MKLQEAVKYLAETPRSERKFEDESTAVLAIIGATILVHNKIPVEFDGITHQDWVAAAQNFDFEDFVYPLWRAASK